MTCILDNKKIEEVISQIPEEISQVNHRALNEVFKSELESVEEEDLVLINKIIAFMAEQYKDIPIPILKEALRKELANQ